MATHFNGDINLKKQITTSDLIIKGRIENILSKSIVLDDETGGIVQTTFKVKVLNKISGDYKNKSLRVTIVGGEESSYKTPNTVNFEKGKEYVMLLATDFKPNKKDDEFVPQYCSCFEVAKDDCVQCNPDIQKQFYELGVASKQSELTITNITKGIDNIIKNKIKLDDKQLKLAQEELQFKDIENEILEMPIETENILRQGKIGEFRKN